MKSELVFGFAQKFPDEIYYSKLPFRRFSKKHWKEIMIVYFGHFFFNAVTTIICTLFFFRKTDVLQKCVQEKYKLLTSCILAKRFAVDFPSATWALWIESCWMSSLYYFTRPWEAFVLWMVPKLVEIKALVGFYMRVNLVLLIHPAPSTLILQDLFFSTKVLRLNYSQFLSKFYIRVVYQNETTKINWAHEWVIFTLFFFSAFYVKCVSI